jgi:hypothetical protein
MGIMDLLNGYSQHSGEPQPSATEDFGQVAREASPEALSDGLQHAFNSDATPPFERMVGQLFERSDGSQRAGLLNEILGSLGGGAAAGGLGGVLGGLLRGGGGAGGMNVSPDQARNVPVSDVETAAAQAAQHNPSIIERVSRFYAQHPQIVQTLGNAALTIAMTQMARRRSGNY